jgi:REP-associated tyrosine transposase
VAQVVTEALRYGANELKLYVLRAWSIMPNHVHILIYPNAGLPRITRAIKGYSARRANELLGRPGQPFWQDESYDHWVRDREQSEKIVRYIEANPVAAGFTTKPEDWRWSSAWAGQEACPTLESQC